MPALVLRYNGIVAAAACASDDASTSSATGVLQRSRAVSFAPADELFFIPDRAALELASPKQDLWFQQGELTWGYVEEDAQSEEAGRPHGEASEARGPASEVPGGGEIDGEANREAGSSESLQASIDAFFGMGLRMNGPEAKMLHAWMDGLDDESQPSVGSTGSVLGKRRLDVFTAIEQPDREFDPPIEL